MITLDIYTSSLAVGAVGLCTMALGGMGRHQGQQGHSSSAGHGGHSHGHAGDSGFAHAGHGAHTHATHAIALGARGHGARGARGGRGGRAGGGARGVASRVFGTITSPRVVLSLFLGFGTVGTAFRHLLPEPLLAIAAAAGALVFERLLVTPIWNFALRFASNPATTLESSITDDATAVTSFDANGQGIVALEVDGQVVQCLGTLQPAERALGVRVRAGERLRIEEVDAARNRCTVSRR